MKKLHEFQANALKMQQMKRKMLSSYDAGDEQFRTKMREFSSMSAGKGAQDLKEEDVGQLAKIGYGHDGQTFEISYPDADKFPGLLDRHKLKYSLNKAQIVKKNT